VTTATLTPKGYLAIILNAHLPYVVNHGTWPHGMEWLHEAAAECYLPLLRVLANLERDGISANFNINLSPILLEQLAHPLFRTEFPSYAARKIMAAREDEAYFLQSGDAHLAETARFWGHFYSTALEDFNALDGDIVAGFRHFNDAGAIEVLTCAATHGYMPLLGTDESARAQVRTAVQTHTRHFGRQPRGIWTPECGYRPAGLWSYPVLDVDVNEAHPAFHRIGVEQVLNQCGLDYFFVDTHLIEESERSPYRTYSVGEANNGRGGAIVFTRDPRTEVQVWSSDAGYPADPNYLDFYKKRFPGGHRYWKVTGRNVHIDDKLVYWPDQAAERVQEHARHFVSLVYEALQPSFDDSAPPVLCAPFDAELFGHWWFEGAQWLEAVVRALDARAAQDQTGTIATTTCSQYLEHTQPAGSIVLHEGSWGTGGNHQVWMNPETAWTYAHIYPAERYVREVATTGRWRGSEMARRIVQQLCRELLLLESSDWQSLITTGAARDYAERRFLTHKQQFHDLQAILQALEAGGALDLKQTNRLAEIEDRDNIFADLDPGLWAADEHQIRSQTPLSQTH